MDIEKLEDEISQQIRNGRDTVYLKIDDLNELGYDIQKKKEERTFISLASVRSMIKKYKFQQRIKVDKANKLDFLNVENATEHVNFKSAESFLDKEEK